MNDMSAVIIPRSDQINADDLLAGPRTFTVTAVHITPGTEQPVSVELEGERRVFRPCKSMCRVMVAAWGKDANLYAGRSMTLYRDPAVKWGSLEVGGIRISHMTHMERQLVIALTATKGNKRPHVVEPLTVQPKTDAQADATARLIARIEGCATEADLHAIAGDHAIGTWRAKVSKSRPELEARVVAAFSAKHEALAPAQDDAGQDVGDDVFPGDIPLPEGA